MFERHKEKAIKKLRKAIKDKEVDSSALNLLSIMNSHLDYFTSSSCYGRIVLIDFSGKKRKSKFIERWHAPVEFMDIKNALDRVSGNQIWIRSEPLILHISCKNLEAANKILEIKNKCGIKRGGIFHINKDRIQIELQGTHTMESLLKKKDKMLVDEDYLKEIVKIANERFKENSINWEKLEKEFKYEIGYNK